MKFLTKNDMPDLDKYIEFYRDKWLKIGLSCDDVNRDEVRAGINAIYKEIKLPPPKIWIWLDSPFEAVIGIEVAKVMLQNLNNTVGQAVREQVGFKRVGEQVGRNLSAAYSHHWVGWCGHYEVFSKYIPETIKLLNGFFRALESGGWIFLFENMVVCTNRPKELHLDDRGRLHNSNTAALSYREGFKVYAWHGVRVPEWVIKTPHLITAQIIQEEKNQEIKRCMIEIVGGERFVRELGASKIHEDRFGELYHKVIDPALPAIAYAKLINSTPEPDGSNKIYWLRVDPQSKTCREAVGRSFLGDRWQEYNPSIET